MPKRSSCPACLEHDIALLAYFPLATGLLTGRWSRDEALPEGTRMFQCRSLGLASDDSADLVQRLLAFAAERELSLVEVALGALAARPGVTAVMPGATTPEQAVANARAADWVPTRPELAELDRILARAEDGPTPKRAAEQAVESPRPAAHAAG